jgi:activator of HSP90 ATPase
MVLHNPNNWHWVNKDVSEWARKYLEENLTKLSAESGDVGVKISEVSSMDGDVDVSQRKGKVITLFDVKLKLEYEGEAISQHRAESTNLTHCTRRSHKRRRKCNRLNHNP